MNAKPGDVIMVRVGGKEYETVIDQHGVQRFHRNEVLDMLIKTKRLDLNQIACDYCAGRFTSQRDYAEFNMALGYSVCGFADLSSFQDMEIENPLWRQP